MLAALSVSKVPVAQWIARWTSNPKVPGSNPGGDAFLFITPTCKIFSTLWFVDAMILSYVDNHFHFIVCFCQFVVSMLERAAKVKCTIVDYS